MARSMSSRDQSDPGATNDFDVAGDPKFAGASQFSYSHGSADYQIPIDPSMNNMSSYPMSQPASIAQSLASQLTEAAAMNATENSSQQSLAVAAGQISASANNAAGMAPPPHTPTHGSYAVASSRASVDASGDQIENRRKRSKVSRACDACRKKKIRCDSEIDQSGLPKTCTNCSKANSLCEFNGEPKKRGPSKGYIKELSDRVHTLEQQQQQPGYRPSLDAGSSFAQFSDSQFTPTAGTAQRSQSVTESQSIFSQPDYSRPRDFGLGDAAYTPADQLHSRDRSSFAIAPDQQPGVLSSIANAKPFWSSDFEEPPPAKRQKRDHPTDIEPLAIRPADLNSYYKIVHPRFALLPAADTTVGVLDRSSPRFQHAFAIAVDLLPKTASQLSVNGDHDGTSARLGRNFTKSTVYPTYDSLLGMLRDEFHEHPGSRSQDDNLSLLWTYHLIISQTENDVNRFQSEVFSKKDMIHALCALSNHVQENLKNHSNLEPTVIDEILRSTFVYNVTASVFHSLAHGSPLIATTVLAPSDIRHFPDDAAFIALASNSVSALIPSIQSTPPSSDPFLTEAKKAILGFAFKSAYYYLPDLNDDSPLVKHFYNFLNCLWGRYALFPAAGWLCASAAAMVLFLQEAKQEGWNPLECHCYVLVAVTLLELMNLPESSIKIAATEAMDKLQPLVENHFKLSQKETELSAYFVGGEDGSKAVHWSEALLIMIDKGRKAAAEAGEQGTSLDFGLLIRKGYLNVLQVVGNAD